MNMKNQPARALVSSGFIFCFGALLLLPTSRFAMVELPIEPHSISGNNAPIAGDEETVIAFENPLREAGKISSHFGITQNPFTQKRAHHDGIDIKAKLNTEVYTAAAGKVIKAVREYEVNKGYGKYVVIQHAGDFQTCYTHLNEVEIEQGVEVRTGDLIGKVGTTGKSTGPHLHFEIRKGKAAMDPEHYVGFAPQMANESHKINPIKIGDLAFVHPLKNAKVTSVFGPSIDPFNKKSRNHRGLDLATKSGTEIKAPANGTVLAVQENKNFGKYILVDHGNDLKSRYTHLEKIIVEQGQHVKQGDVIGLVGSTGRSTGPHLHLEFIYDGAYINPDCVIGE